MENGKKTKQPFVKKRQDKKRQEKKCHDFYKKQKE